ncbi:hypothetical protein BRC82_03395 [Halobacteriales archaeon QS_1_67_19]|nr:MAG: hypothetical protein BRC82_03395 [Halobacteriales archaeon QS_1_67_19]
MRRALFAVLFAVLVVAAPATSGVALADEDEAGNSAALTERWAKTVGGDADDKLATGVQTDDGYLVVGWSNSSAEDGEYDGYVAKLDRAGQTEWEHSYGGAGTDKLFAVEQVDDGYLLAGMSSESADAAWTGWLLKIDDEGDVQWERTYGDGPSAFWSLASSGDSVYVGGWQKDSTAEAWAMELESDGTPVWSNTYDTARSGADEYVSSVFVDESGELLLTGTIEGSTFDPADAWALKVGTDGELQWDKTYGGTEFDRIHDAAASDDGGYVLAGRTASDDADDQDGWVFKIEADGTKAWEHTYGTEKKDGFFGIHNDPDDGYVFSGNKHVLGEDGADGWVVKTDSRGVKQWGDTYGEGYWDKFWPVVEGHDGGYLAIGESTSYSENRDGWMVRLGGPVEAAIEDAEANSSGTTVRFDASPVQTVRLSDSNVSGVFSVSEEADAEVLSPPGEPVYAVTMDSPESVADSAAMVEFTVRTDEIDANVSDLRVAQQTDDGWSVLETTLVEESNGTAVLSATADASATLAVTAVDAPTARIGGDLVVSVGESATLSAEDSSAPNGSLTEFEWTIDGDSYDGETASVSFDEPGEYPVNLSITDSNGIGDKAAGTLVVNDEPEISVDTPDSATVGKAESFSADVSNDVGNATVTWQFGDAEVEGESIEHSFGSPGTKTVTVVVEDEYGATVTEEVTVEVNSQDDGVDEAAGESTTGGDGGVPGFGVGAALVALLAAALLARRGN